MVRIILCLRFGRWRKKKNVVGARFRQPDSAPTTKADQPGEPLRLRFDDCCHEGRNQSVAQDESCVGRYFLKRKAFDLRYSRRPRCRAATPPLKFSNRT